MSKSTDPFNPTLFSHTNFNLPPTAPQSTQTMQLVPLPPFRLLAAPTSQSHARSLPPWVHDTESYWTTGPRTPCPSPEHHLPEASSLPLDICDHHDPKTCAPPPTPAADRGSTKLDPDHKSSLSCTPIARRGRGTFAYDTSFLYGFDDGDSVAAQTRSQDDATRPRDRMSKGIQSRAGWGKCSGGNHGEALSGIVRNGNAWVDLEGAEVRRMNEVSEVDGKNENDEAVDSAPGSASSV